MASTQIKRRIGASIPIPEDANKKRAKDDSEKDTEKPRRKSTNTYATPSPKKPKHENDARHFKFTRKRAHSLIGGNGKYLPLHKRRKKEGIIPPTKFLLGGNIYDPLNLNSLQDEEINRAVNAVTPRSSPLPTPRHRKEEIQVLIPPNINDPLNLAAGEDGDDFELKLVSPKKRKGRRRKKHVSTSSAGDGKEDQQAPPLSPLNINVASSPTATLTSAPSTKTETCDSIPEGQALQEVELELPKDAEVSPKDKEKKLPGRKTSTCVTEERKSGGNNRKVSTETKDKIVSPVVPQPGARKRPPAYGRSTSRADSSVGVDGAVEGRTGETRRSGGKPGFQGFPVVQIPQVKRNFNKKSVNYQYGNYNRYYGYRNPNHNDDTRLQFLSQDLFEGNDVLDIGCNVGHITLIIARDMGARSVVGMDIDKKLINAARSNVRHYLGNSVARNSQRGGSRQMLRVPIKEEEEEFPTSMPVLYGPIDAGLSHLATKSGQAQKQQDIIALEFPHNVQFVQGNYVLDCDSLLEAEQPKFDVILCLSVTKWIHLNWGDDGLKRAFRRMFAQLRPGGILILEPQAWASYKKKKNITETISKNYHAISFFPQKFTQYLLSEVGFKKCEVLGMPQHPSKGFQRPIQLFYKGSISPLREGDEIQRFIHKYADRGPSVSSSFQSLQSTRFQDRMDVSATSCETTGSEDQPSSISVRSIKESPTKDERVVECMVREPERETEISSSMKNESSIEPVERLAVDLSSHEVQTCDIKSEILETDPRSDSDSGGKLKEEENKDVAGKPCARETVEDLMHSEATMEINVANSPIAGEKEHSEVSL